MSDLSKLLSRRIRPRLSDRQRARCGAGLLDSPYRHDVRAGSNLSAEAAAFGGQPAIELPNNGSYSETLTGDYAVSDTLPPSDQSVFWQTFTQISLNGNPFFTENAIVGPESQDDIWSAILNLTGLNKAQLAVLKAILVNHNLLNTGGEFDYAYNRPLPRAIGRPALLLSAPTRTSPPPRTSAPTWTHSPPSTQSLFLTAQMSGR